MEYTIFLFRNCPAERAMWGPAQYYKHVVVQENQFLPLYLYLIESLCHFEYFINKDLTISENLGQIHFFLRRIVVKEGRLYKSDYDTTNRAFFENTPTMLEIQVTSRTIPIGDSLKHHKKLTNVRVKYGNYDDNWDKIKHFLELSKRLGFRELLDTLEAIRKPINDD